MTSLSAKEREALQTVFNAISEAEPKRNGRVAQIRNIIFSHTIYRFSLWMKKGASYQK